jgi:hypothetical protein
MQTEQTAQSAPAPLPLLRPAPVSPGIRHGAPDFDPSARPCRRNAPVGADCQYMRSADTKISRTASSLTVLIALATFAFVVVLRRSALIARTRRVT